MAGFCRDGHICSYIMHAHNYASEMRMGSQKYVRS